MKIFLWLIAVVAGTAIGFYVGFGYGAKTMTALAAQNEVTDAVAGVRMSLDGLGLSDSMQANKIYEENLTFALVQIGTYSQGLAYWACSDKDREAMQGARKYVEAHPELLSGPVRLWQMKGLQFCDAKARTRGAGA
ncbi:hypothetical protein [Rhodanobacter sp. A1T4]|jgi:hypothetical protein|uniref:hypothetical protein n=1 Tax=Rhodanobacter sp. A1T4 TaxID=2723087 RepID=UPI001620FC56|nr:hypothetical protein [Rhodanobacter sp. A1T4]MBB6247358.1 hypothetical protein [Rhodanobacter sp. A1T4]